MESGDPLIPHTLFCVQSYLFFFSIPVEISCAAHTHIHIFHTYVFPFCSFAVCLFLTPRLFSVLCHKKLSPSLANLRWKEGKERKGKERKEIGRRSEEGTRNKSPRRKEKEDEMNNLFPCYNTTHACPVAFLCPRQNRNMLN